MRSRRILFHSSTTNMSGEPVLLVSFARTEERGGFGVCSWRASGVRSFSGLAPLLGWSWEARRAPSLHTPATVERGDSRQRLEAHMREPGVVKASAGRAPRRGGAEVMFRSSCHACVRRNVTPDRRAAQAREPPGPDLLVCRCIARWHDRCSHYEHEVVLASSPNRASALLMSSRVVASFNRRMRPPQCGHTVTARGGSLYCWRSSSERIVYRCAPTRTSWILTA